MTVPARPGGGPEQEVLDPSMGTFAQTRINVRERRERARAWVAGSLVLVFGITVLAALLGPLFYPRPEELRSILELLLPAETALLGSAVGF